MADAVMADVDPGIVMVYTVVADVVMADVDPYRVMADIVVADMDPHVVMAYTAMADMDPDTRPRPMCMDICTRRTIILKATAPLV